MCYTFLGSVTQVVIIFQSESNEESASCDRYHILFFDIFRYIFRYTLYCFLVYFEKLYLSYQ